MRLWHDDVRPPPEGWVWARTNEEAKYSLMQQGRGGKMLFTECSLDHDLGLHDLDIPDPATDPDGFLDAICHKGQSAETGLDLVNWMVEYGAVPDKVTIHSWNPAGAQNMAARLNRFGYDVTVAPYRLQR